MNVLILLFITFSLHGWFDAYKAEQLLQQKEYDKAYELNKAQAISHPENPSWWYQAGHAAFEQQEYAKAKDAFLNASLASKDVSLQKQSLFNAGSCSALLKEYSEALSSFEKLLKIDPQDEKARERYELIKQLMEQQKQEQEQEQQKNENQKDKDQRDQDQKNDQQDSQKQDSSQNDKQEQPSGDDQKDQPKDQSGNNKDNQKGKEPQESKDKKQKKDEPEPSSEKEEQQKQGMKEEEKKEEAKAKQQQQQAAEKEKKENGRFAQLDKALQSIEEGSHNQLQQYVQEQTSSGNTRQW